MTSQGRRRRPWRCGLQGAFPEAANSLVSRTIGAHHCRGAELESNRRGRRRDSPRTRCTEVHRLRPIHRHDLDHRRLGVMIQISDDSGTRAHLPVAGRRSAQRNNEKERAMRHVFGVIALIAAASAACLPDPTDHSSTSASAPPTPSAVAGGTMDGKAIFDQTCIACHSIGGGDRTVGGVDHSRHSRGLRPTVPREGGLVARAHLERLRVHDAHAPLSGSSVSSSRAGRSGSSTRRSPTRPSCSGSPLEQGRPTTR